MLSKRSLTWGAIAAFIIIMVLQTSSYLRIALTIKDAPLVPGDPKPKAPDDNTVHATSYKRDYTTVWSYTASLVIVYALLSMISRWCQRRRRNVLTDRSVYCRIRQLLDYEFQVLDSTLTFGNTLRVSGLLLLNGIFIVRQRVLHQEEDTGRDLFHQEYANRAAQLALVNLSAAVALSVRRAHSAQFGIDETLAWHAWFAKLGGLCALYHACFQFARKYFRKYHDVVAVLFSNTRYTTGTFMMVAMFLLVVGSHPLVRTLSYRLFRATHVASFLVIAMAGGFHHWTFVVFYASVACVWLVDQFKLSWPARLVSAKALPGNIVKLQLEPSFPVKAADFMPGQFAFVSFSNGWFSTKLRSHPFSISRYDQEVASGFPSSSDNALLVEKGGKAIFTFYIRANGRHTASIYQIAQSSDHTCLRHMRLSKPLGKPSIDVAGRGYGDFEVVVLIAEGIGITPWLSVLQQLSQREHHVLTRHVTLIWSVRSAGKQRHMLQCVILKRK
ncbi:hypothetical protein BJV82DRAFT_602411 [Fennellomyces sp. T-0311]|nr:hypothetical protein BJV82DRAFT_602411 [Fennellomyces sp. T-0311]